MTYADALQLKIHQEYLARLRPKTPPAEVTQFSFSLIAMPVIGPSWIRLPSADSMVVIKTD